jgi:hypothetical protein
MKISYTSPTSVRIEMEHGEEMTAIGPMLAAFGKQVTIEFVVSPADPPPVSAFRLGTEEEAVQPDGELALFVKDDGMTAAPGPAMPKPKPKRPSTVYLTAQEAEALRLLRQHEDGLTTPAIARIIGKSVDNTAAMMWRLRTQRPGPDTTTPLVTKISGGRFRVTALGKNLKLIITKRPNSENRKQGWMA